MANRRLKRIKDVVQEQCVQLSKHQIHSCKDVLMKNVLELMNIGFNYHDALALFETVGKVVSPKPTTVFELLEKQQQWFLPFHLKQLDVYMYGGLPSGTITEITGPPGCGKTQFCMMLSSLTVLDSIHKQKPASVVYIDTENAFTAKRLGEITSHHLDNKMLNVKDVAEKVIVYFESSFSSLLKRLEKLEEVIIEENVKLVIVDSIASLARKEFSGTDLITDRNNLLMKEATLLKYYAESFNIPVFVTNQVTTSVSSDHSKDSCLIAALGNTWAHAVNTRLMVRYTTDNNFRELLIAKSPVCKLSKVYYHITGEGIVLV